MLSHVRKFLLLCSPPNLQAHVSASRPISQSCSPNPSLEAQLSASRSKSHLSLASKDLGLKAGIRALKLRYEPGGWGGRRRRRRNFCTYESIGHQPLQGCCLATSLNDNHILLKQGMSTDDQLTLLLLFLILSLLFSLRFLILSHSFSISFPFSFSSFSFSLFLSFSSLPVSKIE